MKKRENLRILYVQIREDAPTKREEFSEFVRFSGLAPEQFSTINVFDTPNFSTEAINGYDALFVGGSSDATGLESIEHPKKYPYAADLRALFRCCIDESIPVFASCYGFEEAVTELGGKLLHDNSNVGTGFACIEKTSAGRADPIFADTPDSFFAISWHSERAAFLPDEAIVVLAHTPSCPYAAIRVKGKPFYGFQFHPEIDRTGLINRLERYISRYMSRDAQETLERVKKTCPGVPFSNHLVRTFVDRIVLKQTDASR